MLAYGTGLLKAAVPSIADYLPSTPNPPSNTMVSLVHPLTPFCCVLAIPASFRHLVELLPRSTTHSVLAKPLTGAPLNTAFLVYVTDCYHNTNDFRGKEVARVSASAVNLYYAIIQLTVTKSVAAPTASASKARMASISERPTPSRSRLSSASMFKLEPVEEGFMDILLPSPATSSQYISTSSKPSFYTATSSSAEKEVKYFVPIENSRESTILGPYQRLRGDKAKAWKEISERDALECLKFPESGISIGDGETWRELEGRERLVCAPHGMEFEVRSWIRDS